MKVDQTTSMNEVRGWNTHLRSARKFVSGEKGILFYFFFVTVMYLLAISFGLSSSSIGIISQDGKPHGDLLFGKPVNIRGDEFLRGSPTVIGGFRNSNTSNLVSPFDVTASPEYQSKQTSTSKRIVSNILLPHDKIMNYLPISMRFAAYWWKFTFYLLIGLPLLFRLLNVDWKIGAVSAIFMWSLPVNQWWSLWPTVYIGSLSLASGLLLVGIKIGNKCKERRISVSISIVMAVSAALISYPMVFSYQPWSIPVALFFAVMGSLSVLATYKRVHRTNLIVTGAIFFSLVVTCVWVIYRSQAEVFESITSSVYPGTRRSFGYELTPLFSGPITWRLFDDKFSQLNQSELAGGAFFLIIPALVLLAVNLSKSALLERKDQLLLSAPFIGLTPLITWVAIPWPEGLASSIPYLTVMTTGRTFQVLGMLAVIPFFLILGKMKSDDRRIITAPVLVVIFVVTWLIIGRDITAWTVERATFITPVQTWVIASLTALVVLVAVAFYRYLISLLPLIFVGFLVVGNVNPLMKGLGIFGNSEVMDLVTKASKAENGRFAFNNNLADTLLLAGGVKQLSGQQGNGPNRDAWRKLDPDFKYVDVWNKAGAYVTFAWRPGPEISISSSSATELIVITIDPCNSALDDFELTWVGTLSGMDKYSCLTKFGEAQLQGAYLTLYKRN